MTGRFAGLKSLQQFDDTGGGREETVQNSASARPGTETETAPAATPSREAAVRPWEAAETPSEPVKALNGRVPRSVRLAFDRQLTDAMDTLRIDVTVDLAVEALARLVIEHDDVREHWLRRLWELKRGTSGT